MQTIAPLPGADWSGFGLIFERRAWDGDHSVFRVLFHKLINEGQRVVILIGDIYPRPRKGENREVGIGEGNYRKLTYLYTRKKLLDYFVIVHNQRESQLSCDVWVLYLDKFVFLSGACHWHGMAWHGTCLNDQNSPSLLKAAIRIIPNLQLKRQRIH